MTLISKNIVCVVSAPRATRLPASVLPCNAMESRWPDRLLLILDKEQLLRPLGEIGS